MVGVVVAALAALALVSVLAVLVLVPAALVVLVVLVVLAAAVALAVAVVVVRLLAPLLLAPKTDLAGLKPSSILRRSLARAPAFFCPVATLLRRNPLAKHPPAMHVWPFAL